MGRHSRGGGGSPPPEPEPPAPPARRPHPVEDTGAWDRSTYRVVDVGLPPGPRPASSFPLGGTGRPLRSVPEEPARGRRRAGATRVDGGQADPGPDLGPGPGPGSGRGWVTSPGDRATRADLTGPPSRAGAGASPGPALPEPGRRPADSGTGLRPPGPADTGSGLRRPIGADPRASSPGLHPLGWADRGSGVRRPDPADTGSGLRRPVGADPRASGAGRHPLGWADTGSGLRRPDAADTGSGRRLSDSGTGLHPLGPADTGSGLRRPGGPGRRPLGPADTGSGLHPLTASAPGLHPLGADTGSGLSPLGPTRPDEERRGHRRGGSEGEGARRRGRSEDERSGRRRGDDKRGRRRGGDERGWSGEDERGQRGDDERGRRWGGSEDERGRWRGGDTPPRYGATRVDLGAGTHGSAALAAGPDPLDAPREPDEVTDTGARRTRSTFHVAEDPDPDPDEPSLLLLWGVFVAQTLTGAAVGLGVWLGFYRLWSLYPLYAAPAVGVATIAMLGGAQVLRRRHGADLDLLTAVVTIAVSTVLTVLPAAFTLQNLA